MVTGQIFDGIRPNRFVGLITRRVGDDQHDFVR